MALNVCQNILSEEICLMKMESRLAGRLQRTNVVEVMSSRTDIRPVSSREVRPDRDRMDRLEGFLSSW